MYLCLACGNRRPFVQRDSCSADAGGMDRADVCNPQTLSRGISAEKSALTSEQLKQTDMRLRNEPKWNTLLATVTSQHSSSELSCHSSVWPQGKPEPVSLLRGQQLMNSPGSRAAHLNIHWSDMSDTCLFLSKHEVSSVPSGRAPPSAGPITGSQSKVTGRV